MSTENVTPVKEKLDPVVLRAAIVLVIGALAPMFDSTMMNVAIHTVATDMKTTISVVQWVATAYVMAMALTVSFTGWATKRFGCKRSYIFSLVLFLIGSICSMMSWNIESLILFRIVQGAGAGLLMPILQTELVHVSSGRNLGQIMAIVGIPALLAPILGPVLGGILVNAWSWHAIFWINIPICIVAIPLCLWGLPDDKVLDKQATLDGIGILFFSSSFAFLIYGISQISSHGGITSSAVYIPLILGVVLMASYVVYALNTKREPVLNLRLFKSANFSASNILLFLDSFLTTGALFILPLYYQVVRGEGVLSAGLWLLPQGIGMLLARGWAGRAADRNGPRNIVFLCLAAVVLGTLPFAFANTDTNYILLSIALLIRGAGVGSLMIVVMSSAYLGFPRELIPHATIATRIFHTIGGSFGSAILATVVSQQMAGHTSSDLPALTHAYDVSFWWVIVFAVVAVIPTLFLTTRKKSGSETISKEADLQADEEQ